MLRHQVITLLAVVLLAVGLIYGLTHLFALRFEHGDIYPPYSTLRADPLGAKALFDSIDALPEIEATRNYRPLPKLRPPHPVTLIYAGVPSDAQWGKEELQVFDTLVAGGTRAVFTFLPENQRREPISPTRNEKIARNKQRDDKAEQKTPSSDEKTKPKLENDSGDAAPTPAAKPEEKKAAAKKPKDADDLEAEYRVAFREAAKSWGFEFAVAEAEKTAKPKKTNDGAASAEQAVIQDPKTDLETSIHWHSALYFKNLKPEWHTLYSCAGKPVIIERKWGQGSLLLAADSYFVSNEALRNERAPRLLAYMLGPATVVFDEEHNGVTEEANIAGLARKYRLQGVVACLGLIAALFLWRNVVRFIPPYQDRKTDSDIVGGQDSTEGFVNLLRRSIPPKTILQTCETEWRKSFSHDATLLAKFETALAGTAGQDPVTAYTSIASQLRRSHSPTPHPSASKL